MLYLSSGRYQEAEPLLIESLSYYENIIGKYNPRTICALNNLVYAYEENSDRMQDNAHKSFILLHKLEQILLSRTSQELLLTKTQKIRRLYLNSTSKFFDLIFSFAIKYPTLKNISFAFNALLWSKHVLAEETIYHQSILNNSNDPKIIELKMKISELRKNICNNICDINKKQIIAYHLDLLNNYEMELHQIAKQLKPKLKTTSVNINKIKDELPLNSAIIEFRFFNLLFTNEKCGQHVLAFIFLSDDNKYNKEKLFLFDIGPVSEIIKTLKIENTQKKAKKLYQVLFRKPLKISSSFNNCSFLFLNQD